MFWFFVLGAIGVLLIGYVLGKKQVKQVKEELPLLFKAHSMDLMEKMQSQFFQLANETLYRHQETASSRLSTHQKSVEALVDPLKETIQKLEEQNRNLEKERKSAYTGIEKQLEFLLASEKALQKETYNLSKALRSPSVRGTWGQLHLRRVVELAGLQKHCDFWEQPTEEIEGKKIRPDLVVRLPGERQIIVDAKTPLYAYLEAVESEEEGVKLQKMKEHASHIRKHVKELSQKEYWKQFSPTPECVILFLPSEAFFSEAVRLDPDLIEMGFLHNVIVATPTTLMSILKAASLSWKQDGLSKNAQEIADLGKQLYERLVYLSSHFSKLGDSVEKSAETFNQVLSSFKRVAISAKKLQEKTHHSKELSATQEIEEKINRPLIQSMLEKQSDDLV